MKFSVGDWARNKESGTIARIVSIPRDGYYLVYWPAKESADLVGEWPYENFDEWHLPWNRPLSKVVSSPLAPEEREPLDD
jgi:hypothetical protein